MQPIELVSQRVIVSVDCLQAAVVAQLIENGCADDAATAVAGVIVAAERDGCHSHGVYRIPGYLASLKSGKVDGKAVPKIVAVTPGVLVVDGCRGFAAPSLEAARQEFTTMVDAQGVAALAIKNVFHFSALWADIEWFCRQGLVAMAFTSYLPVVASAGGSRPVFGTNPMAFGWPRSSGEPMIFDQASSVMARGEVMMAARDGRSLPLGTGIDAGGQATINASEILAGAMLPFGGYKGSAIALMVELLAGPLIGENLSMEAAAEDNGDGGPPRGGEFILAMAPSRFSPTAEEHAERMFRILESEEGVRLPAGRRYHNRRQSELSGIALERSVADSLKLTSGAV